MTPVGSESLIVKAALRNDLLRNDFAILERRVAVMYVTAVTEEPTHITKRVVAEVGRDYAIEAILFAKWLKRKLGGDQATLAAWVTERHPTGDASKAETRALIAGSGYETYDWYGLERILRGAHRFVHPPRGRPPRRRR
jgi:hypothetical protein